MHGVVADAFPGEADEAGSPAEGGTARLEPPYLPLDEGATWDAAWLRSRTISDRLRVASGGTAKIASIAFDAIATLPGAGHGRAEAYLYHADHARFEPVPDTRSRAIPAGDPHLSLSRRIGEWNPGDRAWLARYAGADHVDGEANWLGLDTTFPHDISGSREPGRAVTITPAATEAQLSIASRLVPLAGLGDDEMPDLLAIGIGATGRAARVFGPRSWEFADNLLALDRMLAELLEMLQRRTRVTLLITGDHGLPSLPDADANRHRVDPGALRRRVDDRVDELLSRRIAWTEVIVPPFVYMTTGAPFRMDEAVTATLRALEEQPEVARAYAVEHIPREAADPMDRWARESVRPGRGGEVYVVLAPGYQWQDAELGHVGTAGGGQNAGERTVPVLIVGAGVEARRIEAANTLQVAPTLAALLGVPRQARDLEPLEGVTPRREIAVVNPRGEQ